MKILIAEDDFISRKLLNKLLDPLGEVDCAADGKEALTAVKMAFEDNQTYDLICLDIRMPEVDGITALKKIRELEAQKGLNPKAKSKIIMTSASSEESNVLSAVQAKCDGFLVKPIDKDRLYFEIRKHGFDIREST